MNKNRRNSIQDICIRIERIIDLLKDISIEEEMYYDSIPENLQGSERAALSEEAMEYMDESIEYLEKAYDRLNEIM